MQRERCVQLGTGSCLGCPIIEVVKDLRNLEPNIPLENIQMNVGKAMCPPEATPVISSNDRVVRVNW